FAGAAGTAGTVYIDDLVLFNSTAFAESARVAQTFTKSTPTGASPNPLRLVFDLEATSSSSVVANLEVTIGNTVEWSETPVAQGTRTVEVGLSGDTALQASGSFTMAVSLRVNGSGGEEPLLTELLVNVTMGVFVAIARCAYPQLSVCVHKPTEVVPSHKNQATLPHQPRSTPERPHDDPSRVARRRRHPRRHVDGHHVLRAGRVPGGNRGIEAIRNRKQDGRLGALRTRVRRRDRIGPNPESPFHQPAGFPRRYRGTIRGPAPVVVRDDRSPSRAR